jgi:predicted O-methyltransferase YrrM
MVLFAKRHFVGRQDLRSIEIGVAAGDNALSILRELPIERLFLIDPYIPYEDWWGHADYSADYAIAHTKLAEYPQVVWLRKTSESAIREFRNEGAVDFVYIDGDHSYESVKKDITLYYPLIRKNGLIGGHDYTPYYETVMRAVNEFAEGAKLELHKVFPDWWFIVSHAIKIEN